MVPLKHRDVTLPTVSLVAIMMSCDIDAKKEQLVVVNNIPGDLLDQDMDTDVHMLIEQTIAQMIIKLEPRLYRSISRKQK